LEKVVTLLHVDLEYEFDENDDEDDDWIQFSRGLKGIKF
jgi:hypothetical protein